MYRTIVYVGMLSAVLLSTEASACGAEEKAVVNKGCSAAGAVVEASEVQPMCDASKPVDAEYETAYNTCDGEKPADKEKGKDKGEGEIKGCLSAAGSTAGEQSTQTSRETVFSFLKTFSYGVCKPASPVPDNASAGG